MPLYEFVKTVVYFGDTGFGIAVVPTDKFLDLVKVGQLLGSSNIRLANQAELDTGDSRPWPQFRRPTDCWPKQQR